MIYGQYLIIGTIVLCGCTSSTSNEIKDNSRDSLNESMTTTWDGENFTDFFERFKTDTLFQLERVKFPFTIKSWDSDGEKFVLQKIDSINWTHLNFEYKDNYSKREIDAYTQTIKNYRDSVKIELRGIDNGIRSDIEFYLINKKWYLISSTDLSM